MKLPEAIKYDMYRMDVELVGANKHAKIVAEQEQAYYENYFTPGTGDDGAIAHSWGRVTYKEVYPNIDWVLYTSNGKLKHEFIVHKGGKVNDIKLKYDGATSLQLGADGTLKANTPQGAITEQAPYTYDKEGKKVDSKFTLNGNILSYETGSYDEDLVIDPSLAWATYYGGSGREWGRAVTTDNAGNVYMAGNSASAANVATSGAHQTIYAGTPYTNGNGDALLVKFDSTGTRLWATYYGGSGEEAGNAVKVDDSGYVYLAGLTASATGIATSDAYQSNIGGGASTSEFDAFLVKFDGSGTRQWATYYGGAGSDAGYAIAIDDSENVYFGGQTSSTTGIATAGSFQTVFSGGSQDLFLVKFNSSGNRQWGTYYGGTSIEYNASVAIDHMGGIYLATSTASTGIASAGAFKTTTDGSWDGLLVKFNSFGERQWATYYGGIGHDEANAVATDNSGNVYLTGYTSSTTGIATTGAYKTTLSMDYHDAFLVKFNSAGIRQWGTYFGGNCADFGYALATDNSGDIYMAGSTCSTSGIATPGAYKATYSGTGSDFSAGDGFLAIFGNTGIKKWGTYFGGSGSENFNGIALDANRYIYVTGLTSGYADIASTGAYQSISGGSYDAFLAKFNFNIAPITGPATLCPENSINLIDSTPGGFWTSSNIAVATVGSESGIVTGITAGTVVCAGQSTTSLSGEPTDGTWSSGTISKATINPTSGAVTGVASGSSKITYTLTNEYGCAGKDYTVATVNALPAVGSISGPGSICMFSETTFSNSTTGGAWSTTPLAVATVGSISGYVTGISAGMATITYTVTGDNGCSNFKTKTVTVNALPYVSAITSPAGTLCQGTILPLTETTTGTHLWTSDNTAVATVNSSSGVVTGVSAGTATIAYKYTSGCIAYAMTILTVNPQTTVSITDTPVICVNANTTIYADPYGGSWSSGTPSKATIDASSGYIYGMAAGTSKITYAYTNEYGCISKANVIATVNALPAISGISGTSTVCVGAGITFTDATTGGEWISSNAAAATINSTSGEITGISDGTSLITYEVTGANGCIAFKLKAVTVNPLPYVPDINTGAGAVCPGATLALTEYTSGGSHTWSSANTAVATINAGTGAVTGVSAGTVTISYRYTAGCTRYRTADITVSPAVTVDVISGAASVDAGAAITLTDATPDGIWSSSNATKATVGAATGIVNGISPGTANITYTVTGCSTARSIQMITINAARSGNDNIATANPVSIFPNPTTGTFTVQSEDDGILTVYTLDGRLIDQYNTQAGNTIISLPSSLARGAYLCRYNGHNGDIAVVRLVYGN